MTPATDLLLCAVIRKSAGFRKSAAESGNPPPTATPATGGEDFAITPEMIGAGIGTLGGGALGYLMSEQDKKGRRKRPWLNAALGAGLGGLAGTLGGKVYDHHATSAYDRILRDPVVQRVRQEYRDALDRSTETPASSATSPAEPNASATKPVVVAPSESATTAAIPSQP